MRGLHSKHDLSRRVAIARRFLAVWRRLGAPHKHAVGQAIRDVFFGGDVGQFDYAARCFRLLTSFSALPWLGSEVGVRAVGDGMIWERLPGDYTKRRGWAGKSASLGNGCFHI